MKKQTTTETTLATKQNRTKVKRPTTPKVGAMLYPKPADSAKFIVDSPDQGAVDISFIDRDQAVMRAAIHSLDTEGPAFVFETSQHNPRRRLCAVVEVTRVGEFFPIGGGL